MNLLRITDNRGALYEGVWRMLSEAFPDSERRQKCSFDKLLLGEERFFCMGEVEGRALLCYWDFTQEADCGAFVYVEYLAVAAEWRGRGMGRGLMGELFRSVGVPVVLEVEPPVCEVTRRRVAFYESLGLRLLPDFYMQPSYGVVPGVELRLMVGMPVHEESGGDISVGQMVKKIHGEVYGVRGK